MVTLHDIVKINNITNITIRGEGNTIVMCNNTGGVSFNNSSNVVIEGITWDQCVAPQSQHLDGGINFHIISNLIVQNCTFQHSKVRALSLFKLSGFFYVTNSSFISNANAYSIFCNKTEPGYMLYSECYTASGGLLIVDNDTTISNISIIINIENCIFSNNGYFGDITNNYEANNTNYNAALSIVIIKPDVFVNISIQNTTFSVNRGAGVNIYVTHTNPNIELTRLHFWNNSVTEIHDNTSVLKVFCNKQSTLIMSLCSFYGNHGGLNMVSLVVAGEPSQVSVDHCTFLNNKYSFSFIEFSVWSKSILSISDLSFNNNTGAKIIMYLYMYSFGIKASVFNINIERTFGSIRGLIYIFSSRGNSTIKFSKLNFINNVFDRNSGGINILGSLQETFQIHIQDSFFSNNSGLDAGTVIYSSLMCTTTTDGIYLIFIENCTFSYNKGQSIVYVGMECSYYFLPAYLILNTEFINNTGTPLKLFNIILVGSGTSRFQNNIADLGAALHLTNSFLPLNISSFQFDIRNNLANQ